MRPEPSSRAWIAALTSRELHALPNRALTRAHVKARDVVNCLAATPRRLVSRSATYLDTSPPRRVGIHVPPDPDPHQVMERQNQLAAPRLPHDPNRQAAGRIFGRSASACRPREVRFSHRIEAPRCGAHESAIGGLTGRLVAASGVSSACRVEAHVLARRSESARCRGRRACGPRLLRPQISVIRPTDPRSTVPSPR